MTRTKPLDPLVTTFGRLLEATHHLEDRLGRDLEASSDLPLTWFEVLLRLSRCPGGELTMGELSEQLALTSGGVTRLVDRMSAAGYVERRPCATDRRVQFTAITPDGRAALTPALRRPRRSRASRRPIWPASTRSWTGSAAPPEQ
jgi:DNA-binding MarR family transcriptional regulator